jgi:methionine-gamma-lyase
MDDTEHKFIKGKQLRPESLMMSYGYRPEWSEGAVKIPIFQTSTFAFRSAEEGKAFFKSALGEGVEPSGELGLIYSRLNNPDLEVLEDRLTLWDEAEVCAVFQSGMAAISTTLLEIVRPGEVLFHSEPVYGGTYYLLKHVLPRFGITSIGFKARSSSKELSEALEAAGKLGQLGAIFIETPANPTNSLIDIKACAELAAHHSTSNHQVLVAVDNTFLGPLWQHPLKHGADLVLYSATKFIGGHSDVIAGVCLGCEEVMNRIRALRTFLGTMAGPWTGWLLLRSLETLKLRMTCQMKNARYVADFLLEHPKVEHVYYLGNLTEENSQCELYRRQCLAPGSMISFDVIGGEAEAFKFLNGLRLFKLAVSLGGTESLAEHPSSMTHSELDPDERLGMGITDKMVRLSIGVEHPNDLILDLEQALEKV